MLSINSKGSIYESEPYRGEKLSGEIPCDRNKREKRSIASIDRSKRKTNFAFSFLCMLSEIREYIFTDVNEISYPP